MQLKYSKVQFEQSTEIKSTEKYDKMQVFIEK